MPQVKFLPFEIEIAAAEDDSLLTVAQNIGVTDVECCGMNPLCGKCKVSIIEGEGCLTKMRQKEFEYAKENGFLAFQRLGCLARIQNNGEEALCVELENTIQSKGAEKWHKANLES